MLRWGAKVTRGARTQTFRLRDDTLGQQRAVQPTGNCGAAHGKLLLLRYAVVQSDV